MFSIPINPKLSESQFRQFLTFCNSYKEHIYDLYFTCRMPPFTQDAMGDVIVSDPSDPINVALWVQANLGIRVSATFNNTLVRPTQENLDLFIKNFKQLYDAGVRSVTLPHTHWLATGQIQNEFPELFIKNTILRNVTKPNEVAKLAEAGFHYINLDRDLMRDHDTLKQMRRAADKYNVKLSLLANEGCAGGCIMMDEHYEFNNSREGTSPQYFNDVISRVSCPKWEVEDPSIPLKTANFPPWREDWAELLQYVDVIKLHGRESITRMFETMDIVKRYANNKEILFDTFNAYLKETNLEEKPINAWRKIIKTCKFECWDCNFCDRVYEAKSNEKSHPLITAVTHELVESVNYNKNYSVMGLTSPRVQKLLYKLSTHCKNYLEVGSALGATASAVAENTNITVNCVDNWATNVQPASEEFMLPDNTKELFLKNMPRTVNVWDMDMFEVDLTKISGVDLFFYDGPHEEDLTTRAVKYYSKAFADTCIMIFDDANWAGIVSGADTGIEQAGLRILYSKKMLNEQEDLSKWWNGLYIVVVQKNETSNIIS